MPVWKQLLIALVVLVVGSLVLAVLSEGDPPEPINECGVDCARGRK